MSLIVHCLSRSNSFLLTAAIEGANLPWQELQQNSTEFLKRVACSHPRFALLTHESIHHPELLKTIRCCSPDTCIVVCWLNEATTPENVWELMDSIDLDVPCILPELTDCLVALQQGNLYRSSLWAMHPALRRYTPLAGWQDLTISERQVLRQLIEIRTGPQIAEALNISPKTVNNHKTNISQKLNVSGGPGSLLRFIVTNRDRLRQLLK